MNESLNYAKFFSEIFHFITCIYRSELTVSFALFEMVVVCRITVANVIEINKLFKFL